MKSFLNTINQVKILFFLYLLYIMQADVQTKKLSEKIISGSQAALGQFPWQVILKRNAEESLWCGGSIISENWVLVAAHCTFNVPELLLIFGSINLEHYENAINMTSSTFFMHPEYNDVEINNDIALIKLPTPLTFTNNIQAIALVSLAESNEANNFVDADAILAGFGQVSDEPGIFSEVLLYAQLQIISNSRCLEFYNNPDLILDSVICAIGYNDTNMSPCKGDSGGPLIWKNNANNFVQIGIDSFVALETGCTNKYPSGFTRVSSYLDFIRDITSLNFE